MFALGNKTYEHFNAVGKFFDKRLEQLGGERMYEVGIGDDDTKYAAAAVATDHFCLSAALVTKLKASTTTTVFYANIFWRFTMLQFICLSC